MADANITNTFTVAGTLVWDDGDTEAVSVNTAYGWTFSPTDTSNYEIATGTLIPYKVSSSGGGVSVPASKVTLVLLKMVLSWSIKIALQMALRLQLQQPLMTAMNLVL